MSNIVVIYHSGYGHTTKQAKAVCAGADSTNLSAELIAIDAEGNIPANAWEDDCCRRCCYFRFAYLYGNRIVAIQKVRRCFFKTLVCTALERQESPRALLILVP